MKNLDLKQIDVQELSTVEKRDVDGGTEIHWWMYLIAPGSAYIVDKFLDGMDNCECP